MEMVAKLVKKYKLARLCRIGVWIVVIAGAAQIASSTYSAWLNYHMTQLEMGMNTGNNPFIEIYGSPTYVFSQLAGPIFENLAIYTFYGIALYAASVVFTAISAQPATGSATSQPGSTSELDSTGSEEDPDRIVYTSLKHEDIAWDRQQINNHKSAGHRS